MKLLYTLISLALMITSTAFGITKTVGPGGNYTTMKAAFDAINAGTNKGTVILQITGSTTETATAALNASGVGSASYTSVSIYPTGSGFTISGNLANTVIDLNGADNVTIDGRVNQAGALNLTITNTNTQSSSTIRLFNSASGNTVKYCIIKGSETSSARGVIMFSTSSSGSGNTGNSIENNNITSDAAGRCTNGVFSSGSNYPADNSGNSILNNNIFDFINSSFSSAGVYLGSNSTAWTINGNSFYETSSVVPTAVASYYGIQILNTSGNGFMISDNYIGGRSALCGGLALTITSCFTDYFCGIYLSCGTTTVSTIQNNVFSNMNYTSTEDNPWDGFFVNAGSVNVTGNTIGATTGTGSITITTPVAVATATLSGGAINTVTLLNGGSGYTTVPAVNFSSSGSTVQATATAVISGGAVTGITINSAGEGYTSVPTVIFSGQSNGYSTSHGMIQNSLAPVSISNNNIGSITTTGSVYYSHGLETIYVRNLAALTSISGNLLGSLTSANSLHVSSTAALSLDKQDLYGIYSASTATTFISGNTIANLTNSYTGINSLTRTRGIQTIYGTNTIQNNVVRNISSASGQSSTKVAASVIGISQASATAGLTQSTTGNTVHDISSTNGSATVYVYGIYSSGSSSGSVVSNNFVHSLSLSSAMLASEIDGISLNGGVSTCSDNIINLGVGVVSGYKIFGIYDEGGAGNTNSSYFNTVYIGGTPTGTTSSTVAFWSNANTSARNYRNNILYNARSGGSTGKHYAIRINGTSSLTIDYNDYYVSGTNGVLGDFGADKTTLLAFQTASGQDAHSLGINPGFALGGGTAALNYYISATLPGTGGTGITTDYSGINRGIVPKMGALEANNYVWQGSISTDFNTAGNWTIGEVPPAGADIAFAASPNNNCILDQDRITGNITNAQSTYKLIVNGRKLTINNRVNAFKISIFSTGSRDPMLPYVFLMAGIYLTFPV